MSKKQTKKIRRPQQYKKAQTRTFKEWYQDQSDQTRKLMQYAVIAVLAIAVLVAAYFGFIYDDGSLKIKNGAVVGAQDNWLITNLGTDSKKKYYHLADMDTPEGYAISEESAAGTSTAVTYATTFTFKPTDEASPVSTVYVSGVSKSPADMATSVYSTFQSFAGETGVITEVTDVPTALGTAKYFSYEYSYTDESVTPAETSYSKSLVYYVPTQYKDASVLVSVIQSPDDPAQYLSQEELLALIQPCLEKLTIADKK